MDEIGSNMTDSKPLTMIKQAITRLKSEINQMDLRLGVIDHTLIQAKVNAKGQSLQNTSATQPVRYLIFIYFMSRFL